MKIDGRMAVSLMMLAIFVFFVGQALAFRPDARAMPLLVGIPGILLCLVQIVLDWRKQDDTAAKAPFLTTAERSLAIWLLLFLLGIIAFGFGYGAPPLVAAYLFFAARERPWVAVAGGAACALMLILLFEKLLKVQLFEGLVTPLLF